jgi:hypothetical protein
MEDLTTINTSEKVSRKSINITATAFMDDTTWFSHSKKQMQKTLNISSEFLSINDIKANGDKSTLICINVSPKDKEQGVILSDTNVPPQTKNSAIRVLRV